MKKPSRFLPAHRARSRFRDRLALSTFDGPADLLAGLVDNGEGMGVLEKYMSALDDALDVRALDKVGGFVSPTGAVEELTKLGLKVIELDGPQLEKLFPAGADFALGELSSEKLVELLGDLGFDDNSIAAIAHTLGADDETTLGDTFLAALETGVFEESGEDYASDVVHQLSGNDMDAIKIDRSDVITRLLKARLKDPSVTVVYGPQTRH